MEYTLTGTFQSHQLVKKLFQVVEGDIQPIRTMYLLEDLNDDLKNEKFIKISFASDFEVDGILFDTMIMFFTGRYRFTLDNEVFPIILTKDDLITVWFGQNNEEIRKQIQDSNLI